MQPPRRDRGELRGAPARVSRLARSKLGARLAARARTPAASVPCRVRVLAPLGLEITRPGARRIVLGC
eukprot:7033157-Alexandrium_andersonii.AAC.1